MSIRQRVCACIAVLTVLALVSCSPQQTPVHTDPAEQDTPASSDLPFETIEQRVRPGTGHGYESRDTGLVVVTRSDDVASLGTWISEDAKNELHATDYDSYLALAVFQGWKGTDGYSVQIERITLVEDQVTIFVQIEEPPPDGKKNDIVTSPYHLVRVPRGDWAKEVTFNVDWDGVTLTSSTHTIP